MCANSDNAVATIEGLVQKLYPAIQYQFLLVGTSFDLVYAKPNATNSPVLNLLREMRAEFQSLVTYENRSVFPAVLSAFKQEYKYESHPDIADMLRITKSKEQRLFLLLNELSHERRKTGENSKSLQDLAAIFRKDFARERECWNKMIQDRLTGCSCFVRTSLHENLV